jgi:hypothetical protein
VELNLDYPPVAAPAAAAVHSVMPSQRRKRARVERGMTDRKIGHLNGDG